jgi:hypothetical protein
VVSVGTAVLEAILLAVVGPSSSLALAPQVSAPAPFGAFHDLRWLAVYHDSWAGFGAELVGLLIFRTALDSAMVRLAWPAGVPRPPLRKAMFSTAGFTVVVVIALAPWTLVLFGAAVAPISWLFLVAVPPVVVVASLTYHGPASRSWWRQLPPLSVLGWVLATFVLLSASAAAIQSSPVPIAVLLVGLTGVWNALGWSKVVAAVVGVRRPRRAPLVAPFGSLAMVGIALGGAALGFAGRSAPAQASPAMAAPAVRPGEPAVLVVAGFGTSWDGTTAAPVLGGYATRWFSYRGTGADGGPLPYGPSDTQSSLSALDQKMAAQVQTLHAQSNSPWGSWRSPRAPWSPRLISPTSRARRSISSSP